MQEKMSVEELAERLSVSKNTVRAWLDKMAVEAERGASGRLYYASSVLPVLETFKAMRGEGKGLATITRIISTKFDRKPDAIRTDSESDQEPIITRSEIAQVIKTELAENNDLAEKYARAAHRIGELESDNKHLLAKVEELRGLLEAPKRPWWRFW